MHGRWKHRLVAEQEHCFTRTCLQDDAGAVDDGEDDAAADYTVDYGADSDGEDDAGGDDGDVM